MGLEFQNDVNPTNGEDGYGCPLVNFTIDQSDCLETTMGVVGYVDEMSVKEKFKCKEDWKEICSNCVHFRF